MKILHINRYINSIEATNNFQHLFIYSIYKLVYNSF